MTQEKVSQESGDDAPATIIVAADDDSLRSLITTVLTRAGYSVRAVPTGAWALAQFAANPSDLIITDVLMPNMDGIQLIRKLYDSGLPVRILAVTGFAGDVDYLEIAESLGALRTLRKPFRNQELLAAVEASLSMPARSLKEVLPESL